MPRLTSRLITTSASFDAQRAEMLSMLEGVRALEQRCRDLSNSKRAKFERRGKMLPRDRVSALLDPGTPWLELSTLAGLGMHDDDGEETVMGGGSIVGIGFVSGVRCIVSASDAAIKGGTISPMGLKKQLRALEISRRSRLPLVSLVESGGANLNYQSDLFVEGGRVFYELARLSAAGIPTVTVVHGSSTAGGAYIPGLSDYVVMVRDQAKVFLAGPPLLRAATGEVATDEELGGAEMHASVSGVAEYLAEDDADGIRIARDIVSRLGWKTTAPPQGYDEPSYDIEELCGLVPVDYRKPYDVREVIARLVDGSEFLEFKERYGSYTICGHASIQGHRVGILGNNGPIDEAGSVKAGQFIQLCSASDTPLLFLQNTTGYMVGTRAEQAGIVKHGSKMIQAVANAPVPKLTLLIGGSFGAGNYGMCGRAYQPDFMFAWPNARIAVMGGEQAAGVMRIVFEGKIRASGGTLDEDTAAFIDGMTKPIIEQFERESRALFATARLWDDGIIDPRDSRAVLGQCLAICTEARGRELRPSSFGVARM